jgi:hypothetical protein
MEMKNPKFNNAGGIDVEINHPTYGWIPCSLHPGDPSTADLYAAALAGESGAVAPYVKPLEQAQSEKITELEAAYAAAVIADVLYMGWIFQADQDSQLLLLKATANNGRKWYGEWKDKSNVMHSMTYQEGLGLFDAIADLVPTAFLNLQIKKQAVRDAKTIQQVEPITWS